MIDTYHWKFKKLLPSISGYFHYINKLSEDVKFSFVIALYIGLFSLELFPIIVSTEKAVSCYCPLYRAIFTFINSKGYHGKNHKVIALYIGLFSQSEENAPWIAEIFESYCPLYRAIFTIINIMIL